MWWSLMLSLQVSAAPPPMPGPPPSAWSCTRVTLASDVLCAFDGAASTATASPDLAKENARAAAAMFDDLCRAAATVGGAPEPSALAICVRARGMLPAACDYGASPLVDEQGRFNRGHARCYAAMRTALDEVDTLLVDARGCCACATASCGAAGKTCHARLAQRTPLDAGCASTCANACAAVNARAALAPKSPRRKP